MLVTCGRSKSVERRSIMMTSSWSKSDLIDLCAGALLKQQNSVKAILQTHN